MMIMEAALIAIAIWSGAVWIAHSIDKLGES